jgi:protein TonB
MSDYALQRDPEAEQVDRIGRGLAGAVLLHVAVVAGIAGAALFAAHLHPERWGERQAEAGAIQASMVSAIPLPAKAPPVKDSVLASEDVTTAPAVKVKEATQPPPKPTDVLIKGKTPTKVAPVPKPMADKHPQPTPPTPRAASGDAATQLPQSIAQVTNGTASLTVMNKAFGDRYAYYLQIVGRKISENWLTQEADPRASQGKSVTLIFDVERDGTPANVRVKTPSGSASLDASAIHALQRVDGFGPLPAGNQITIEDTFDYHR